MSFQVILKRCSNEQVAAKVTEEVAAMSGASPDQILGAVTSKSISIGKDFSEEKALELKAKFEALGVGVTVKNLDATATEAPAAKDAAKATTATATKNIISNNDDDDDEEEEGRVLTEAELVKQLNERADIFVAEQDRKLRVIMPIVMAAGLAIGVFLATVSLFDISPDFYNKMIEEKTVTLSDEIDLTENLDEEKEEEKKEEFKKEKKKLKPTKGNNTSAPSGGGDPRAVVTKKGVLGIISGAVKGSAVANSDVLGKGGYASGIDAVLKGVGGLKKGGGGGTGRKGAAGIGFGTGYGSGFGGGSGGVDDLLGSLMGGGGSSVKLKKRGNLKVKGPSGASGAGLTGGRSRANIMRVVRQNMASLKYAYNRRLAEKPGLKGKITVKWAIDEFGKVLFCKVVSSTINDPALEKVIIGKIKRWAFGKIQKPGDVTEVVYPFVFTQ